MATSHLPKLHPFKALNDQGWLRPAGLGFVHPFRRAETSTKPRERKMRRPYFFLLCASVLLADVLPWDVSGAARSACNDTEGRGCRVMEEEEGVELELDSEINRMLLAGLSTTIVYGVLDSNHPVCVSSNGRSYNCNGKSGQRGGGRECVLLLASRVTRHETTLSRTYYDATTEDRRSSCPGFNARPRAILDGDVPPVSAGFSYLELSSDELDGRKPRETKMRRPYFFLLCASVLLADVLPWDVSGAALSACNDTEGRGCRVVEEEEGVEFELDSEINRRLLAGGPHIGKDALNPNRPVCLKSGCNGKSPYTGGGKVCGHGLYRC
ncbi:hypothetical protein B296_00024713 [Ensete ventricosum]|uniref:Uncharacterized protein n=1 Tax=Ensete ventricosum TaxID=4639 RepID=A0A426XR85_ENSVE|nr:hypothetical protein B296_00024713 [Ensete ventricosum]